MKVKNLVCDLEMCEGRYAENTLNRDVVERVRGTFVQYSTYLRSGAYPGGRLAASDSDLGSGEREKATSASAFCGYGERVPPQAVRGNLRFHLFDFICWFHTQQIGIVHLCCMLRQRLKLLPFSIRLIETFYNAFRS